MSDTSRRSRTSLVALLLGAAAWVVSCENPLSPELCGTIPDQTIAVGGTIDVAPCFRDPNGEALVFEAFSSDTGVATVQIRGSTVTVTAVYPGTAVVTIVATDPGGLEARQSFQVVVPDRPPSTVGTIDDRELMVGDSAVIDVRGHFAEPDGQPLRYSAEASAPGRLAVSVEGTVVTVVALAKGTALVTVTATDPGGLAAEQRFEVTVPNRPPVAVDSIAAREVMVDRADTVDVSPFFSDPDGDSLIYAAAVSDGAVVEAAVAGSTLTLKGLAKGAATVTVTATDDEGLAAEQRFEVTVPNRPPLVTGAIPSRMLYKSEADTLRLTAWFSDPDGDPLTWAAQASAAGVVALDLAPGEGTLVITPLAEGEMAVTVTATDPEGLAASQSFTVTVPNRPPAATDTIPSRTLYKSEADTLDLTDWFSDPDGDRLTWGGRRVQRERGGARSLGERRDADRDAPVRGRGHGHRDRDRPRGPHGVPELHGGRAQPRPGRHGLHCRADPLQARNDAARPHPPLQRPRRRRAAGRGGVERQPGSHGERQRHYAHSAGRGERRSHPHGHRHRPRRPVGPPEFCGDRAQPGSDDDRPDPRADAPPRPLPDVGHGRPFLRPGCGHAQLFGCVIQPLGRAGPDRSERPHPHGLVGRHGRDHRHRHRPGQPDRPADLRRDR